MDCLVRMAAFCSLLLSSNLALAQVESTKLDGKVVITANEEVTHAQVISVFDLLNEHSISRIEIRVSENPGISVQITAKSSLRCFKELEGLLKKKEGVTDVVVRPAPLEWEAFSFAKVEKALEKKGAVVFLRADWCATCELMENEVFKDPKLHDLVNELKLPFFKADYSGPLDGEDAGSKLASQVGTNQVPAFILFFPEESKEPKVVHEATSAKAIIRMLKESFGPESAKEGRGNLDDKRQ